METKLEYEKLSDKELSLIEGGNVLGWLLGGLAYVAHECVQDWECFKDGLKGKVPNHDAHK